MFFQGCVVVCRSLHVVCSWVSELVMTARRNASLVLLEQMRHQRLSEPQMAMKRSLVEFWYISELGKD